MKTKIILTLVLTLFSLSSFGESSALCNDLARFSCAPGNYKDVTGSVKSASDMQRFMSAYGEKTRQQLNDRFKKILDNPDNLYFKDLAISGLGLKSSPQCASKSASDISACRENLIDGLSTLAQKHTLSPLLPSASLARMGSIEDVNYIMQNEVYQNVIKDLNEQVGRDLSNPDMEKKIKDKIFPEIKSLIIDRLNKANIPDDQKKDMVNKIKSIQFAGTNCTELNNPGYGINSGSVAVTTLLMPNALYNPERNTFKFCSGFLLQSTSEFHIAMTIAHELSHSIDPCLITFGPSDMGFKYKNSNDLKKMEQEYPFKNVIACLRDPKSVEAKRNYLPQKNFWKNKKKYFDESTKSGLVELTTEKPSFCNNDQVTESFSDWLGAEVLPSYIAKNYKLTSKQAREGYANASRILCWVYPNTSDNYNFDVHPAIGKRINKILLLNPAVRSQMGCPEKHPDSIYCNADKVMTAPDAPLHSIPQQNKSADSKKGTK